MSIEEVQKNIIFTYNKNIEYIKVNHPNLYNKVELFNVAIDIGKTKVNFDLHYENDYFDIINLNNDQFLYNQNSYDLSMQIVNNMSLDARIDSFKTFYDTPTNDNMASNALESEIMISYSLGNAPVVNFVNKNLPNNQNFKDISKFITFGVLLGIHLPILQKKINPKIMLIVEPNLEIFRLSLFTVNYSELANNTTLLFSVAENEIQFRQTFEIFYGEIFIYNHYLKFLDISNSISFYSKVIQNFLVSQGHYLFSYERSFLTLYRTNSYINDQYKILNLKYTNKFTILEKPVLILGAGPSLQKSINFVKENQKYFTIIAIYATLPLLEKNAIKPDIITQYDAQDTQVLNTLDKLQNKNFFNESIFIFSSHVNKKLLNNFPKQRIFIFQALFEVKEGFGILTSPSIGELTFAISLILQAKEIYLLGLDLALDSETGNSHIEGHSGSGAFNELKDLANSSEEEYTFRKHTILVKGNFLSEVKTVPVFKASIDAFSDFCYLYKKSFQNVYNLSNGAYLYDTIPLNIENINFNSFEKLNMLYREEIFNKLEKISEIGYSEYDLNNFDLKLLSIRKIKNEISNFLKYKHKNFEDYKNYLINLIQFMVFEKHNCKDLQNIILNYFFHNLHYIFYLFDISEEVNKKKFIYEINKSLFTQINKIINTYVISISYSINENDLNMKKLDKFLKNYDIKETLYLEPLFNEIVETSEKGLFKEYKENSIGFFGTLEVLSNKAFLKYVKEIIELIEDLEIKIFYFFDFQRTAFEQIFRKYINKIEFIKPQSFDDIKNNIKIWFEIQPKTESQKKITDLTLNNCINIYSCFFDEDKYNIFIKNNQIKKKYTEKYDSVVNEIKERFVLPDSNYFQFANNLKDEVLNINPTEGFLKEHIGFLAVKENLEKNFIEKIISIYINFPNIKYSVFYFEEADLINFKNIFINFINKFNFIKLRSINDIISNSEIYVQADIKNQSFLFYRIFSYLHNYSLNIYPIILGKDYYFHYSSENYQESLIPNFLEISFIKSLNKKNNLQDSQLQVIEDCIGFLATNDNLEDLEFIKLMNILFEKSYEIRYKAFYFDDGQKELIFKIFNKYLSQIDFIKLKDISEIISNISIYIHSQISFNKPKNQIYNKVWQILNQNSNMYILYIFEEIENQEYFSKSLRVGNNSKIEFNKSIISKIFENDKRHNEFSFMNSLNQDISEEMKDMYCSNNIGFLATNENLEDIEFVDYVNQIMKDFLNYNFKAFYFDKNLKDDIKNKFRENNNLEFIQLKDIKDIFGNIEVYLSNYEKTFKNIFEMKIMNILRYQSNDIAIIPLNLHIHRDLTLFEFENQNKEYFKKLLDNIEYLGFKKNDVERCGYNFNFVSFKLPSEKYCVDIKFNINETVRKAYVYYHLKLGYKNHNYFKEVITRIRKSIEVCK